MRYRARDAGPSGGKLTSLFVLSALLLGSVLPFILSAADVDAAAGAQLKVLAIGDGVSEGDMFGTSMVVADLDGDGVSDLVVGAPGSDEGGTDSGAIYVFEDMVLDANASMNARDADVAVFGLAGDMLGSALSALEDVDNDGVADLVVGAKRIGGIGKVMVFSGPALLAGTGAPLFTVDGAVVGGGFGSSIASLGDLDGDKRTDMAVGEPGGDRAYVIFGDQSPVTHTPELWAWDPPDGQPVTFEGGVNNTPFDKNTFGLGTGTDVAARNDGWDWSDGPYGWVEAFSGGGGGGNQPNGAYEYAAPEPGGPDADGVTQDGSHRIEVQIGPSHTGPGPSGTPGGLYSGAWGIQVQVTPQMYAAVQTGARAKIGFDWEAMDAGQSGSDDPSYIKARFGNLGMMHYLGQDLGGDAGPEVFFKDLPNGQPSWGPVNGNFDADVTNLITGPGWYYIDLGAAYDARSGIQRSSEGLRAYFDDVSFRIIGTAWSVQGPAGSRLGQSVLGIQDRSGDGVVDLAVGAPRFGGNGGAVLVLPGPFVRGEEALWNASMERYLAPQGQALGTSLAATVLDADGLTDIAAGALGINKVYLMPTSVQRSDWWPTLWVPDSDGVAGFQNGFGKAGNTWGPGAGDDGWDTAPNGVYGGMSAQVRYNPSSKNSPDGSNRSIETVKELEIALGGGNYGEQPATAASGAYGIQFDVPKDVFENMTVARLRFKWYATDANGIRTRSEEVWVKARFGTAGSMTYLGTALDVGSDASSELGYAKDYEAPGQKVLRGYFDADVTALIKGPGTYYLELGGKVQGWGNPREYMLISFDDVGFEIGQGPPSFGPAEGSGFGAAVSRCYLTGDGQAAGLAVGSLDGGVHYFNGTSLSALVSDGKVPVRDSYYSDPEIPGLGTALASEAVRGPPGNSVDGVLLAGAPAFGPGTVAAIKMFQAPKVTIESPANGAVVKGVVVLRAAVEDPHVALGDVTVEYGYSNDGPGASTGLQSLGTGAHEGLGKYSASWDTALVQNGNYTIRVEASDGLGIAVTAFITVTVSNLQSPKVALVSPSNGTVLSGNVTLKASLTDLDMNMESLEIFEAAGPSLPVTDSTSWRSVERLEGLGGLGPSAERELVLDTTRLKDGGPYWLLLRVMDEDDQVATDVGGPFQVWNPDPPSVHILSPTADETFLGAIVIKASVTDPDGDIDERGARFYFRAVPGPEVWNRIDNDPAAEANEYSVVWDPQGFPAQEYAIKVNVTDRSGLVGEATVFIIKGTIDEGAAQQISVVLENPRDGETVWGNATVRARVTGTGWQSLIGSVCLQSKSTSAGSGWSGLGCSSPTANGTVEAVWNTTLSINGTYELRATAQMAGGAVLLSPPIKVTIWNEKTSGSGQLPISIAFLGLSQGEVLKGTVVVTVLIDCQDRTGLEDRVTRIYLLGSSALDGYDPWTVGDAVFTGKDGNGSLLYSITWDTNKTQNGYLYVRAVAVDDKAKAWPSMMQGPVEIRNSPASTGGGGKPAPVVDNGIVATFIVGAIISTVATFGAGWSVEISKYQMLKWFAVPFMPLYSKIKREKVLDHVHRKRIFKYIIDNPGDNFSNIREKMRMSNGSFAYHLWTLEREEFVISRIDGNLRRFYPMKGTRPPKDIDGLNWFQLGLLDAIRRNEGRSLKELAEIVGESPQVLNYHLKVMTIAGLVRKQRDGKVVRHYLGVEEDELERAEM
jgi:hypothetical protein